MVAELSVHRQCFLGMVSDIGLRSCHQNATATFVAEMTDAKPDETNTIDEQGMCVNKQLTY